MRWLCTLWMVVSLSLVATAQQRTWRELEPDLSHSRPEKRARAVKDAGLLGTEQAWSAVLAALADPEAKVGDAAQLLLAQQADPDLRRSVLGRDGLRGKQARVRRRVSELLGSWSGPVDVKPWLAACTRKDPELTRVLLWSVERQVEAGHIPEEAREALAREVRRLAKQSRDGGAAGAALCVLAALDVEDLGERVAKALGDRRPKVRAAALWIAGQRPGPEATAWLKRGLEDDDPLVRRRAVLGLGGQATRPGVELLIRALEADDCALVRADALVGLRALSGLKHRADPRPWRDWCAGLAADWVGRGTRTTDAPARGGTRASLAGLPIVGEAVSLLVDFSGSTWNQREDGTTRKQRLDKKLFEAIDALTEETRFNVMPYTSDPFPWQPELVPANKKNRQAAKAFFGACRESGRGAFLEAAESALHDPDLQAIVALTDGAPTGGFHHDLGLIVDALLERNRFRPVAYSVVLVDTRRGLVRHWQRLVEASGGQLVELEDL